MPYRESETVELKSVVVDDIKRKLLPLQTVTAVRCISASGMTAKL